MQRSNADDWESLLETLFWLSQPGIHEDLAEAEADIAAGRTFEGEEQVRAALGLPAKQ
jgi:antitoxin YefM